MALPVWSDPTGDKPATIKDLEVVFTRIVTVAVSLAGLALFVMLIIGGFKYLTSAGDPKAAESARNTMMYAVIGLVVIISSFIILQAIKWFTGVDVLKFEIPNPAS